MKYLKTFESYQTNEEMGMLGLAALGILTVAGFNKLRSWLGDQLTEKQQVWFDNVLERIQRHELQIIETPTELKAYSLVNVKSPKFTTKELVEGQGNLIFKINKHTLEMSSEGIGGVLVNRKDSIFISKKAYSHLYDIIDWQKTTGPSYIMNKPQDPNFMSEN